MKKIIIYTITVFIFNSSVYAEKYLCSYIFNQEPKSILYEREGQSFQKSNQTQDQIIFEDEYAITLSSTYSLFGNEKPSTFSTIIDKKRLTFVFVGLEYENSSSIIEGKCKII